MRAPLLRIAPFVPPALPSTGTDVAASKRSSLTSEFNMPDSTQPMNLSTKKAWVNVCDERAVRHWAHKFKVPQQRLLEAVQEVGPFADDVQEYLDSPFPAIR
jgi:hypothetical protein